MARILITSGPTRQYLDPVRYLTNASSGRMGRALAAAALEGGHEVIVVSGPVDLRYPDGAEVVSVVSTEDMLDACLAEFPRCDGLIGVAAPCDYRPVQVSTQKIAKTGEPLMLHLVETADIVAALGTIKQLQWMVAFALETEDVRMRAMQKLERKNCDMIVLNGPAAIHAADTQVEIIDRSGNSVAHLAGGKEMVAQGIFRVIEERLIRHFP
ncbi:MAG: phosphopantothenoylcysteine decarboxylase [Pirellulales bacterium]|nr:phosphopantothenoylcysteine decarboxylase [Pirellulales bacterium]